MKRVLLVTGKINTMTNLTYFGDGSINDIKSIGLVFGPNFFTAYFYSDYDGNMPMAYVRSENEKEIDFPSLANFTPIYAVSFGPEWTLMPQSIFEEKDANTILNFNTKPGKEKAKWNRIIGLDAVICSEPDEISAEKIEHIFPGLELRHGVGALLEYCRKTVKGGQHVFLHESNGRFTLIIFDGNKLLFANSFDGKFDEDVRYFVLYSMKQLKIDPTVPFSFLGDAAENQSIREMVSPYLHQIVVPDLASNDINILQLSEVQTSAHWIGLNAALCAL